MSPTYLCLDYGRRHTGLAVASTPLAEPLTTLPTETLLDRLPLLLEQTRATHLILGLPQGEIAPDIHQLADRLLKTFSLPVILHDETLTSHEAQKQLRHAKKSTRRGPDHHFAAALILQDYLDTHIS